MYEQHFGLERQPFTARAAGPDVFVGPQTAMTMAGIRKALQSRDAVIVVSGPPGGGKSTLVGKALDALKESHRSVRIGRLSLDGADVLEFLLEELGTTNLPRGTIRQFAAFREKLRQLESEGLGLVVVVEDGIVTGPDTLAELEALTAADTGASGGAAIVVMGDQRLHGFLQDPALTRLVQRVRQRQDVAALSPAELRGYLAHCFRNAGANFDDVFAADAAVVIHDLCKGTPRVANKLVEAALDGAAASNLETVTGRFIADIGYARFGLEASEPVHDLDEPDPLPERQEDHTEAAVEPVIVFSDEAPDELDDDYIPELIQDTWQDLEALAPATGEPDALSGSLSGSEPEPALALETPAESVPDWEREPTMAELRPDLDALEKAMAFAHGQASNEEPPVLEPLAREETAPTAARDAEEIPEITLDNAIQERIENSHIEKPGAVGESEESLPPNESADLTEPGIPAKNARKADQELERIATELARAKTLEDVDDKLAETLFGEEFNLVAAQVVANGRATESANDVEMSLFDTGAAMMAQAAGSPVTAGTACGEENGVAALPETPVDVDPDFGAPAPEALTPEPIEDQINTSMTQTLKALNVRPPISSPADDATDDHENKGGFFSRFRRS